MKRLMLGIIVCVALMLGGAGCEEAITPERVQALAAQQQVLQKQLDAVQAAAAQLVEGLEAGGIVDPNVTAKVAKINKVADGVQAQIDVIAKALEGVPLTGDATLDFLAQLQAANAASAGFNPYAVPIGVGLSILTVVLGWFVKRKADEAKEAKAETKVIQVKYQAHKQGVERTMKEVSASTIGEVQAVETQLYGNIGEARSDLGA
jgi:hypothetical protein